MIFVAAGTQDGRELAGTLLEAGYEVTASVVSAYGESLLKRYAGIKINDKPLDDNQLIEYIRVNNVELLVDASHPYAANVSANSMKACHATGIPYIRYERAEVPLAYDKAYYVKDYQEAATKAAKLGDSVFLTTGSRNLRTFAEAECLKGKRVVCRVLPEPEVIREIRELGFSPANTIAMQGPFSKELNKELYKKYCAQVVITKNSGTVGGADTKFAAAMEMGLPLIIIDRPRIHYDHMVNTFEDVLAFVRNKLGTRK